MTTVPDDLQPGNSLDAILDWNVAAAQINTNTANIAAIIAALTNPLLVAATSDLSLNGTYTDVPGASITITTTRANVPCLVTATFRFDANSASTGVGDNMVGVLLVDGAIQKVSGTDKIAIFKPGVNVASGATIPQQWTPVLASAGPHTLKLQGKRNGAGGGTWNIRGGDTSLSVVVFDF